LQTFNFSSVSEFGRGRGRRHRQVEWHNNLANTSNMSMLSCRGQNKGYRDLLTLLLSKHLALPLQTLPLFVSTLKRVNKLAHPIVLNEHITSKQIYICTPIHKCRRRDSSPGNVNFYHLTKNFEVGMVELLAINM